jgi:hypothetical protein
LAENYRRNQNQEQDQLQPGDDGLLYFHQSFAKLALVLAARVFQTGLPPAHATPTWLRWQIQQMDDLDR